MHVVFLLTHARRGAPAGGRPNPNATGKSFNAILRLGINDALEHVAA
jgi:hypothetical protein